MPLAAPFEPKHIASCTTHEATTLSIRADFSQREVVHPCDYRWSASPITGVTRMMLDRIGNEVARATSIVNYAPNSCFPNHIHEGGEEFYVIDGQFSDEHGEYPKGSYVRNPIGSDHSPVVGGQGATLFVKLHQFSNTDQTSLNILTSESQWSQGMVSGLSVIPLHQHDQEQVALVRWAPKTQFKRHRHWSGEEILVLEGVFYDEHGAYPVGSWIRNPHLSEHSPYTLEEGALIYVKTGHLPPT